MFYHAYPNVAERHGLNRIAVRLMSESKDAVCEIVTDGFHISGIWINDHKHGPRISWPTRDTPKGRFAVVVPDATRRIALENALAEAWTTALDSRGAAYAR